MNLTIYSSDIRDLDEVIERQFDISDYYGMSVFNNEGRLLPQDEYEYAIEPHTYLAVMMDMQEQIDDMRNQVELQKKWIKTMKEQLDEMQSM